MNRHETGCCCPDCVADRRKKRIKAKAFLVDSLAQGTRLTMPSRGVVPDETQ